MILADKLRIGNIPVPGDIPVACHGVIEIEYGFVLRVDGNIQIGNDILIDNELNAYGELTDAR